MSHGICSREVYKMDSSNRLVEKPKRLWQRRAALIAWVTVLTVAAVLDAVWLFSDDRASINYPLVVGLGLVGGLALGLVVAYLWDRHAGRLKRPSDIEAATGLQVLGVVPAMRLEDPDRVAVNASQPVAGTQAYGILAAELADTLRESAPTCLLLTSPTRGDGRTTTAVNLATLLAAEGLQVALLSADPHGEGVDEVLELDRRPGLTEVLAGSVFLESALQSGGVDRLRVLTAGGPSDEMLGKNLDGLARVLDRLTRDVDLVVIDAPPVLGGLEAMLLAQDVDLVLFIVDVRHGKRSEATAALAYLGHVQDRLVGVVSNDPGPRRRRRRVRGAAAAQPEAEAVPDISPEPAAATGVAAVAAATALRMRGGARAIGGAVGSAAGAVGSGATSAARSTKAAAGKARGKIASALSFRALRRHPWAGVIASVLAVGLVISAVWWASYDGTSSANDQAQAANTSPAAISPSQSSQDAIAAAADKCHSTWQAQAEPLGAAAKSIDQWQVHVSAMNQLVAGKITLDQANAFWNKTRKHAAHNVRRFQRADQAYTGGDHSCPMVMTAANNEGSLTALSDCRREIAQREDVLKAARAAIATWHDHVMDMNMMRNGSMSPTRALQLWNKYWKLGVSELKDYRSQLRQAGQPNC
jgi:Mrp family chromosome partitioning ATPase